MTTINCSKTRIATWCNNQDVKQVRLKSEVNVYMGDIVQMCAACRKANNGGFKMWPPKGQT